MRPLGSFTLLHNFITPNSKRGIERVQALADISRSHCVVTTTEPVRWLQIRPIVNK